MESRSPSGEHQPSSLIRSQPSWLLARLALVGGRLVEEALAAEGVRRTHFSVLSTLSEEGPMSQAELGRRLLIDRSNIHALMRELEQRRYIVRSRDRVDRRRNVVNMTAAGRRALSRMERVVLDAQAELLRPLGGAEQQRFMRLLTLLFREHAGARRR